MGNKGFVIYTNFVNTYFFDDVVQQWVCNTNFVNTYIFDYEVQQGICDTNFDDVASDNNALQW